MPDREEKQGGLVGRLCNGQEARKEYALAMIKGAIGAIPYAGTLLNEAFFEARSRLKQARLEQFFTGLSAKVAQLDERVIDKAYIQSEEFSDLLGDADLVALDELAADFSTNRADAALRALRAVLDKKAAPAHRCGRQQPAGR